MARKKITDATPTETPVAPVPDPTPAPKSKASTIESIEDFDVIDGFVLENHDKLQRAVEGEVKRAGVPEGGLLQEYGELSKIPPALVLAHYDRLAGYITKNVGGSGSVKVKTGSFWDFKKKAPRPKPKLMYIFNVGGTKVEVDNPANLAVAVTTVERALSEKEQKNAERRARAKAKSLTKV